MAFVSGSRALVVQVQGSSSDMGIKEVGYTEERLISTGQYENMRVGVHVAGTVAEGETAEGVYEKCKNFARARLRERVVGGIIGKEVVKAKAQEKAVARRYNLGEDDDAEIDYSRG